MRFQTFDFLLSNLHGRFFVNRSFITFSFKLTITHNDKLYKFLKGIAKKTNQLEVLPYLPNAAAF